jgi:predicted lysophospholipase L1 biosynthesis ABC-type transport system permease subunit
MKNPENHLETLSEIRSLMERSSRFISLSGLSGVFAGVFALIGAFVVYWKFNFNQKVMNARYDQEPKQKVK